MFLKRFAALLLHTSSWLPASRRPSARLYLPLRTVLPSPSPNGQPQPTPVPATATAVLAPAPHTFTEQFDGILPYWTYQQIDNGQPAADPAATVGFLVFDLTGPNQWIYALYSVPTYTDIRVDAQAEFRGGGSARLGLSAVTAKSRAGIEFNIYPDQTYEILLVNGWRRDWRVIRLCSAADRRRSRPTANEIGLVVPGQHPHAVHQRCSNAQMAG